jgi:hypothetical protein
VDDDLSDCPMHRHGLGVRALEWLLGDVGGGSAG